MSSDSTGSVGAYLGLLAFATLPLAVGCGILYLRHATLRDTELAKSWVETPCTVERCEFVEGLGDDDRPALEIVYRYEAEGQEYRSDRLDLLTGSMGDDDIMENRVHQNFPPGAKTFCYVDPKDPSNAVFDRDHALGSTDRLWILAFPFVCTGLGFWLVLTRSFAGALLVKRTEQRGDSASTDLIGASPPRSISWHTSFAVLAGPSGAQVAWLFVVGFTLVFVIFDGPRCYARLFNFWTVDGQVEGLVTDVSQLESEELGVALFQNLFEYKVGGQVFDGQSYTRGKNYGVGDAVPVTYDMANPHQGRITGTRQSEFTWWHGAVPLGILFLLVLGLAGMYRHNLRALVLLRGGVVGVGRRLQSQIVAERGEGDIASIQSPYYFEVGPRHYRAKWYGSGNAKRRRRKSRDGADRDQVDVLYHPRKPKKNVILDGGLAEILMGNRTILDNFSHAAAGPLAMTAILLLLRHAL